MKVWLAGVLVAVGCGDSAGGPAPDAEPALAVDAGLAPDAVTCSLAPVPFPWSNVEQGTTETVFDVQLAGTGVEDGVGLFARSSELVAVRRTVIARLDLDGNVMAVVPLTAEGVPARYVLAVVAGAGDDLGAVVVGFPDAVPRFCILDGAGPIDAGRCTPVPVAGAATLTFDGVAFHVYTSTDAGTIARTTFDATPSAGATTELPSAGALTDVVLDAAISMGTQHLLSLDVASGCTRLRHHLITAAGDHLVRDPLPPDASGYTSSTFVHGLAADAVGGVSIVSHAGCRAGGCDAAPERTAMLSTYAGDTPALTDLGVPLHGSWIQAVLRDGDRTVIVDEDTQCEYEPPGQTTCYRCVTSAELSRFDSDGAVERWPVPLGENFEGGRVVHAAAVIGPGDYAVLHGDGEGTDLRVLRILAP